MLLKQEKPLYHAEYEKVYASNDDSTPNSKENFKQKGESQLALAHEAIRDKRVTLTEKGCWVVRAADNETPYVVRLFPKETCSCPAVKMCYHLMACKMMIGQDLYDGTKPNMTLLQQKVRQKNKEKPSGRKAPREKKIMARSQQKLVKLA